MYARSRFEALSDGVFSVAMTLLVIDVRLPDASNLLDAASFVSALRALEPKFLAYAFSFAVVAASWLARALSQKRSETVGRPEAVLTLFYLFLVTLTPFSTMALSAGALRSGLDLLPAVLIYCANLGAMGLAGALIQLARRADAPQDARSSMVSPLMLLAASIVAAAVAALGSGHWPYAFLMLIVGAWVDRRFPIAPRD